MTLYDMWAPEFLTVLIRVVGSEEGNDEVRRCTIACPI
jgi:hypothetical protein